MMSFAPYDYRSTGQRMAAHVDLLYQDIQRVVRSDPTLSPARIAEMADLSSAWMVRDIRKPDWFVKNVAHLFKIETALREHPNWHPRKVLDEREYVEPGCFVLRRLVDPFEAPEFRELALRWQARRSDREFVEAARTDPWVNVVDVSEPKPQDFKIIHYGASMRAESGINKLGSRLGSHASSAYADMTCDYFGEAVRANEARCRDVVYFAKSRMDHVIYRGVALPCLDQAVVISKMSLEYCTPTHAREWRGHDPEGTVSELRSL
jgi:hypothetical protein